MDGIIEVKVNGYSISKDNTCAGAQYESNSTKLRITFGENWDGFAKTITFWNALGENPVDIQLGTNLLEDILVSSRVYIVAIPGEAMTEAGEFNFVIQRYIDGAVKRTVSDKLRVLTSPKAANSGEPTQPTPTIAEQLRAEMDAVLGDIADARQSAVDADEAREKAEEAADVVASVRDMTVSSEMLLAGEDATVEKTLVDKVFHLHFGIPASSSGVHVGNEAPVDESANVWIDTDGDSAEYPTKKEMYEALEAYAIPSYAFVNILGGAENWTAEDVIDSSGKKVGVRYGQTVNVNNAIITENSKVDLLITSEQMVVFYEKDLAFVTENEDGVVTVYCVGNIPENDYKIQAMVTEVVVSG